MEKAAKKPRKKATTGYKMPEPIPTGSILTDVAKKQWRLGTSIGKGGFGEIYSASEATSSSKQCPYVIKVEPHGNGPLFVEMHFYMKNAKQADIDAFMKDHKLKTLGMPAYLGSGSHEIGSTKFRFIVIERFGTDVDKLRKDNNGALAPAVVFQLAWQITYVLEYIHSVGYIHADIKGGNVLLGNSPATKNQSYLVDFGLATKFTTDKVFKPNPKKAHDGTMEYLSRDAHSGVPTRRGDFEVLGYNIIHWLGGSLPWEGHLDDPKTVQQMKEDSLKDIPKFVKGSLKKTNETVVDFLKYINNLNFNEEPDYKKIRSLFESAIKKNGSTVNSPLELTGAKKRSQDFEEKDVEEDKPKVKKPAKKKENKKENLVVNQESQVMTEAMKEVLAKKQEREAEKKKTKKTSKKENGVSNGDEAGYTEEMKEIKAKIDSKRETARKKNIPEDDEDEVEPQRRRMRNLPHVNYFETPINNTRKKK